MHKMQCTVHILRKKTMQKRMTITMDEDVYEGLFRVVGRGKVSQFLQELARPHVLQNAALEEAYRAMAADPQYEADADEWIDGLIGGMANESAK
jgi:predicted CopG family antitoxin